MKIFVETNPLTFYIIICFYTFVKKGQSGVLSNAKVKVEQLKRRGSIVEQWNLLVTYLDIINSRSFYLFNNLVVISIWSSFRLGVG